jgi:hypothetical protein
MQQGARGAWWLLGQMSKDIIEQTSYYKLK